MVLGGRRIRRVSGPGWEADPSRVWFWVGGGLGADVGLGGEAGVAGGGEGGWQLEPWSKTFGAEAGRGLA
jgi:hypothetical protein